MPLPRILPPLQLLVNQSRRSVQLPTPEAPLRRRLRWRLPPGLPRCKRLTPPPLAPTLLLNEIEIGKSLFGVRPELVPIGLGNRRCRFAGGLP